MQLSMHIFLLKNNEKLIYAPACAVATAPGH